DGVQFLAELVGDITVVVPITDHDLVNTGGLAVAEDRHDGAGQTGRQLEHRLLHHNVLVRLAISARELDPAHHQRIQRCRGDLLRITLPTPPSLGLNEFWLSFRNDLLRHNRLPAGKRTPRPNRITQTRYITPKTSQTLFKKIPLYGAAT